MVRTIQLNDPKLVHWWRTAHARGSLIDVTCFQSHQWISEWWRWIGSRDSRRDALILVVENASEIQAVAPFFIQHRPNASFPLLSTAHWMGDDLSPYSGLIREQGSDLDSLWQELLQFIRNETPIAALFLRDTLPAHLPGAQFEGSRTPGSTTYRIVRQETTDPLHLDLASPRLRRSLRTTLSRFIKEGWQWELRQGLDTEAKEFLERQSRMNFGVKSFFHDPANCAFLDAVIAEVPAMARWSVLRKGRVLLHVFLSLAHGNTLAYFLAAGVRTKEFATPGLLNLHWTLATMPDSGFQIFDFLRGEEEYKLSFSPMSSATTNVDVPLKGSRRLALLKVARRWRKGNER